MKIPKKRPKEALVETFGSNMVTASEVSTLKKELSSTAHSAPGYLLGLHGTWTLK